MHILVTGGCGFIGQHLVRRLVQNQHTVTIIDSLIGSDGNSTHHPDTKLVIADVREAQTWSHVLHNIDAIVHLAAASNVAHSVENPQYDFDVNVRGCFEVLLAAKNAGVPKFILASSNAPIGKQPPPAHERLAPQPISPYGASKLAGEAYCQAFNGSYGTETIALRFANVFGSGSMHKTSVVARFIRDILDKRRITVYGDGSQTRDFIHVQDIVTGIEHALNASNIGGEVVQLGTGIETSVNQLIKILQEIIPFDFSVDYLPKRIGDVQRNFSQIEKACRLFGFSPQINLRDGIEETYNWFEGQLGHG